MTMPTLQIPEHSLAWWGNFCITSFALSKTLWARLGVDYLCFIDKYPKSQTDAVSPWQTSPPIPQPSSSGGRAVDQARECGWDALGKIRGSCRVGAGGKAGLLLIIPGPLSPSLLAYFGPSTKGLCLIPSWPILLVGIRCQTFLLMAALS